ncbi:TPA: hypothetical protein DIV45_02560 [Patescibacteria group bacterium]|nr:hypothetical protein [Patescibacteria group bacterium]
MHENHESSYVPSVVSWTPIAIIAIIFVILVIVGINAMNQAVKLKTAEEKVSALTTANEILVAELAEAKAKLDMPVYVEVIYDPDETIYHPAELENSTRLEWRLGSIDDFKTRYYAGKISLIAQINDLMAYRVVLPGGGSNMIGDTDLLPLLVADAVEQREELFEVVDATATDH